MRKAREALVTSSEVDSVVHTEPSITVESLQTPPNSSNETDSRVSDQSRNGQHADEEPSITVESSQTPPNSSNATNSRVSDQSRNGQHADEAREALVISSEVDSVVHTEPSIMVESLQTPPNSSNETDCRVSDQSRNGQHTDEVLHIGDVVDNAILMDELARCLDRKYRVMKYWKHLACELNIPPDTQKEFEIYFELSPTVYLFQFLSTSNPQLTIGKLRVALKDIHRNDLIQELKDFTDAATVVGVFENEPSLLDSIALKLDSAKKPVGNWRSLARKLISSGQRFNEFEAQLHSSENPTAHLFLYLHKNEKFSQLTVGDLKGHLKNMERKDILLVLDEVQDSSLLADVFSPDSELLNRVSIKLNKKTPGVKNWRHLANLLGVPNKVYEEFDPDSNSPKRSPTKMMLEWLRAEHPDMTVDELRTAVKEIERGDALEILDGYLFNSQAREVLVTGSEADSVVHTVESSQTPPNSSNETDSRVSDQSRNRQHADEGVEIEASPGGEQYLSPKSTPHEQKQKVNTESRQTGSDEVDNGLPSLQSPCKSQRETRLSTAVTDLPLLVYSKICLKLNIRSVFFSDFRMLGEKVGLSRDEVEFLGQQVNPTDHILKKWSSSGQATVKKLMDVLAEEGLERNDIIEILKDWVSEGDRSK